MKTTTSIEQEYYTELANETNRLRAEIYATEAEIEDLQAKIIKLTKGIETNELFLYSQKSKLAMNQNGNTLVLSGTEKVEAMIG